MTLLFRELAAIRSSRPFPVRSATVRRVGRAVEEKAFAQLNIQIITHYGCRAQRCTWSILKNRNTAAFAQPSGVVDQRVTSRTSRCDGISLDRYTCCVAFWKSDSFAL